jgi:hypothetical protein
MEQRGKFISGMPGQEVDEAQLQDALHNMLKQSAQNGAPALGMFAQLQQRRAARLDTAAKALGKELGKDHPDVVTMQDTAKAVEQFNIKLDTQATRLKTWPKARPNEWVVFGTVLNADNSPAGGLTVRVYDRDRKYDDLLGETETDANGDFSIVYHERDFKETRENLPELYIMVTDTRGNQVYSSRDSVRFNSGQSEYFAIKLGDSGQTPTPRPTKTGKSASQDATIVSRKKKS